MTETPLRGRFAPSPSGPLHLGNLRTALLAWLFARSAGAPFVVRIEDLDAERCRPEYEASQLADLRALGLDWDGEPLRQSVRRKRHRAACRQLRDAGLLYPCWCTRAEIREAISAPHGADGDGAYPGTCREMSVSERRSRERGSRPPAWRVDAQARAVSVVDRLHGELTTVVDDFVVWRGDVEADADSTPAYNLAVVVDDAEQGVGEVVRGDDLLATTPRQVLVATMLQLPVPSYAHVPLVLGPDGERLAKRHGAVTLEEQRRAGVSVAAVVGWMAASAGLAAPGAQLGPGDLLAGFDPARLSRVATTFDGAVLGAAAS
jgi:glutamyl-tRNA synthetase